MANRWTTERRARQAEVIRRATESKFKFLVTTAITITLALSGYMYAWYQSRQTVQYQAQLDRVNQQLREFYGPLHSSMESESASFQAFMSATRPGKSTFWIKGDQPSQEQQKQWRRWITEVTMPRYHAMALVIQERTDLIVERSMPGELVRLQAHIAGYRPVISAWKEGDYSRNVSFFNFPQDARIYVERNFKELKLEQAALLGKISPIDPVVEKRGDTTLFAVGSGVAPPAVTFTSPANGATDVAINTSVSATASQPMAVSTLNTTSFTLQPTVGGTPVIGTISISGNTATFTPSSPLAPSTQYTATITTAATSMAGETLAADYTWQFTTGTALDTTPPTVSSTSPANNAASVALNTSVSASFSEAMTNSTLNTASFTLQPSAGGAFVTGTVNVSGNTASFTPTSSLAGNTQYRATVTTAARDAAGNALASNFSLQFTTAAAPDTTPPTVSSTSPANNATSIALNTSVSVTFSQPIYDTTLTTSSFRLMTTAGGHGGSWSPFT